MKFKDGKGYEYSVEIGHDGKKRLFLDEPCTGQMFGISQTSIELIYAARCAAIGEKEDEIATLNAELEEAKSLLMWWNGFGTSERTLKSRTEKLIKKQVEITTEKD